MESEPFKDYYIYQTTGSRPHYATPGSQLQALSPHVMLT